MFLKDIFHNSASVIHVSDRMSLLEGILLPLRSSLARKASNKPSKIGRFLRHRKPIDRRRLITVHTLPKFLKQQKPII